MYIKYLSVLIYLSCTVSGYASNDGELASVGYEHGNFSVSSNFSLRKCYCEANSIYQNGNCISANTSVDILFTFGPPMLRKTINTDDFKDSIIQTPDCNSSMVALTISNVVFTNHQSLFHLISGENFTDLYCVEHVKKNDGGEVALEAQVCLPKAIVPYCCPIHTYFNSSNYKCYSDEGVEENLPEVYIASNAIGSANVIPYTQKAPKCPPGFFGRKVISKGEGVTLQYQHSKVLLHQWSGEPYKSLPQAVKLPEDFCIGVEKSDGGVLFSAIVWDEFAYQYCSNTSLNFKEEFDQCDKIMNNLLLILLSLSSVFLLLILGLHSVIPELRKSLGSKITICHVASLFCGFCLLLILHGPNEFNCKVYGPLVQMTFLATFFWLNVMCFDIWWKLRCKSPAAETIQSSRAQFIRYSIYAWGVPLLIGVVTVIMDNIPSLEGIPGMVVPGFGKKHCWFADTSATLWYYFGIIAVLMAANAFFFVWVFVILFKANCTYKKVLKNNQKSNAKRTWIYLKIFCVMGITWVFEFLSWKEGNCKYWVVTDIINSLRGLILFIIFFGNKKSVGKIKQRFNSMNQSFHDQVSRSVNSLRKFSMRATSATVVTGIESRRTSEVHAELSNRATNHEAEPTEIQHTF